MQLQASKCYYHPERGAVATCSKCGVGICKECAVKIDPGKILCYQCGNEYLKREHKEYRKWIKGRGGRFREGKDFIGPGIVGALIVIVFIALDYFFAMGNRNLFNGNWGESLLAVYVMFSIPFGYTVLGEFLYIKFDSASSFINLLNYIKFIIMIIISLISGWIIFPFVLIRFIIRKSKSTKNKI